MNVIRVNVSLSQAIYKELTEEVESRGRSRFISEGINSAITERRNRRLALEYRERVRKTNR